MSALTLSAQGSRDPDDAWDRYADPSRWPEWAPQIRRVETAAPRLTTGMSGKVQPLVGPGIPFTVTAVDEVGRTWSWTVRIGPVQLRLEHTVTAEPPRTAGSGSGTTLRITGPALVVYPYAPLAQWALHRLVAGD